MSIELEMLSNHRILCCPLLLGLQSFPTSGSFPMSWFFASGGQSIGASASILPMSIQGWFPLGWTGLIPWQSKGLSGVFKLTSWFKFFLYFFGHATWHVVSLGPQPGMEAMPPWVDVQSGSHWAARDALLHGFEGSRWCWLTKATAVVCGCPGCRTGFLLTYRVPGDGYSLCLPLFPLFRLFLYHVLLAHRDTSDLKSCYLET